MNEASLRDLLEQATASEPPIGPIAHNALAAGWKLRRCRRLRAAAGTVSAAAAAAVVAVVAVTGFGGRPAAVAPPVTSTPPATVFVSGIKGGSAGSAGTMTAISASTGRVRKLVDTAAASPDFAANPDGKDLYFFKAVTGQVLPVSTVTGTAGKPIRTGAMPTDLVLTPNGKMPYVTNADSGTVTRSRPPPIRPGRRSRSDRTPCSWRSPRTGHRLRPVLRPHVGNRDPIATGTNTADRAIQIKGETDGQIAIAP